MGQWVSLDKQLCSLCAWNHPSDATAMGRRKPGRGKRNFNENNHREVHAGQESSPLTPPPLQHHLYEDKGWCYHFCHPCSLLAVDFWMPIGAGGNLTR